MSAEVGTTQPDAGTPPGARGISTAVLVQLVARAAGTVASVLTVAFTTRQLGVHDYGLLTTAVVFVGLWSSLTELGIGAVIVRRVSGAPTDLRELAGVNLGLSLVYCLPLAVVAGAVGLAVYADEPAVHAVLLVVCGTLVLNTVSSCFNPVFVTKVRFTAVAVADVAARLAALAATGVVIAVGGGLVWFGVVQLVPALAQLVCYAGGAHRLGGVRLRFDRSASRRLLRESLPQTGVLIIGVLYWRADAVILTLLGSPRQVGAYGLAYTVAFTLSVLSSFYLASSLSTMTTRFLDDRTGFVRFVVNGMQAMVFMGLPIAVIGGIAATRVVTLLGGSGFTAGASLPLTLLSVGVALTFLTGLLSQALFAAHDQRFLLRLNVVNLVVNIVVNVALVPVLGAVGAAIALLVSEVTGLVVPTWRLRRLVGYASPWPFLLRLVPAAAVGGAVTLALRGIPVVAAVVAAVAGYLLVNLAIGPVRWSTVKRVRAADAS